MKTEFEQPIKSKSTFLEKSLNKSVYKKNMIAKLLGISSRTLYSKLKTPELFTIKEIFVLAQVLNIEIETMISNYVIYLNVNQLNKSIIDFFKKKTEQ